MVWPREPLAAPAIRTRTATVRRPGSRTQAHALARARTRCKTRAVPLSIVLLQSLRSSPRAGAILDRLQADLAPAERQSFRDSAAARVPCNLLPEEARA